MPGILEHRRRRSSRVQHREQEVFGAEKFVLKLGHFALRGIDRLAKICAQVRGRAAVHACASGELGFELLFELSRIYSQTLEHRASETISLPEQSQQKVLGGNFRMIRF